MEIIITRNPSGSQVWDSQDQIAQDIKKRMKEKSENKEKKECETHIILWTHGWQNPGSDVIEGMTFDYPEKFYKFESNEMQVLYGAFSSNQKLITSWQIQACEISEGDSKYIKSRIGSVNLYTTPKAFQPKLGGYFGITYTVNADMEKLTVSTTVTGYDPTKDYGFIKY